MKRRGTRRHARVPGNDDVIAALPERLDRRADADKLDRAAAGFAGFIAGGGAPRSTEMRKG